MKDLLTIEEARKICRINFYHAWWMVTSERWTPVRVGPDARIIRVRRIEVEETRARWDADDLSNKSKYKASAKNRNTRNVKRKAA